MNSIQRSYSSAAIIAALSLAAFPAYAVSLDLTGGGSGSINGAYFTTSDVGSTGTGVIDSFVRVQDNGVADGFNADARPVMPDVQTSPQFTRDLLLGEVPIVVDPVGAVPGSYYEFLLDINQTKNNPLLSLDQILIYTQSTALTSADELSDMTGGTWRYSLDAGNIANEILLNYELNNGSGSGDLFAYIPVDAFAGALATDYVYFYSMFGSKEGYTENDGFEEWAVRTPGTPNVPDSGSTVILLGSAMVAVSLFRRRRA